MNDKTLNRLLLFAYTGIVLGYGFLLYAKLTQAKEKDKKG